MTFFKHLAIRWRIWRMCKRFGNPTGKAF